MDLLGLDQQKNLEYSAGFSGRLENPHRGIFQEFKSLMNISFLKTKRRIWREASEIAEPAGDFAYNGTTSINNSANVIFGPDGTQ